MQISFPHRKTWLHHVNPTMKLLGMLALFLMALFTHNLSVLVYAGILLLMFTIAVSGHPPLRLLLYLSPILLVFVTTSNGMILFGRGTTTWFQYGLIHISEESFFRGVHLGVRAFHVGVAGLLFALTTRPVLLFYSLMQQCKLPPKYAYSFLAAFRLLPILLEEFFTLRNALRVRGRKQRQGIARVRRFYDTLAQYAVPLLAQSIRRAQRIAVAMEAKQFASGASREQMERTYYYRIGFSMKDLWFGCVVVGMMGCSIWAGWTWPLIELTDVRRIAWI
jgi:energy-coupling factor transport system permease protein